MGVRNGLESLSEMNRNGCPECVGIRNYDNLNSWGLKEPCDTFFALAYQNSVSILEKQLREYNTDITGDFDFRTPEIDSSKTRSANSNISLSFFQNRFIIFRVMLFQTRVTNGVAKIDSRMFMNVRFNLFKIPLIVSNIFTIGTDR